MNIVLTGGTGFIGRRLIPALTGAGHRVTLLTRRPESGSLPPGVRAETWDATSPGPWTASVAGADAVINFAGEPIAARRWSAEQKRKIVASRVDATKAIVGALASGPRRTAVLVNASAVGYYGTVPEGEVGEDHPAGSGFLADTCRAWEEAASGADASGARVVLLRIGIVLGDGGGVLERMLLPFRLFLGGPVGSGRQWFPWVHRDDVVGAAMFALGRDAVTGSVNVAAPEPATMQSFAAALGGVLRRPSAVRVPGVVLRAALGEMAEMLLGGQQVVPRALLRHGYAFRHPHLDGALREVLRIER